MRDCQNCRICSLIKLATFLSPHSPSCKLLLPLNPPGLTGCHREVWHLFALIIDKGSKAQQARFANLCSQPQFKRFFIIETVKRGLISTLREASSCSLSSSGLLITMAIKRNRDPTSTLCRGREGHRHGREHTKVERRWRRPATF